LEKKSRKKDPAFRKAISVQERLALTLISINFDKFQYIFNIFDWRKNLEKGPSVQKSHFCSRIIGTDADIDKFR